MTTGPVQQVPAACRLGPAQGPQRLARWRAVDADALVRRVREPGRVVAFYRRDPATAAELGELVAAERSCCGFVEWSLEEGDDLRVVVTGCEPDLDAFEAGLPG